MGGLSKKSYILKQLSGQNKLPLLRVDAGNLLFKHEKIPSTQSQEKITAAGIMAAYKEMNYDAVAVGPTDLAAGIGFLQTRSPTGFPWLSANLYDSKRNLVFSPFMIKQLDNFKAGIIGLTGNISKKNPDIHITSWREVLPQLITSLSNRCDIILLLSSLGRKENEEIARRFPRLQILISADHRLGNQAPKIVNNTLITQTKKQGQYLGSLTCRIGNSGSWGDNIQEQQARLKSRLISLERQLTRTKTNQSLPVNKKETLLTNLKEQRKITLQELKELDAHLLQDASNETDSTYSYRFLALKSNLPEDKKINTIVTNIKKQIQAFNKSGKNKALPNNTQLQ